MKRTPGSILVLMGLIGLIGCGGSVSKKDANDAAHISNSQKFEDAPVITDQNKTAFLKAINDARNTERDCGENGHFDAADPLRWSEKLYLAAAEHNYDMAKSNIIRENHRGSGTKYDWTKQVQDLQHNSYIQERVENNGYIGWTSLKENLTVGFQDKDPAKPINTPEKAIQQWIESPGHCANLMSQDVEEVGMAYLYDNNGEYKHYWTQDFGKAH